MAKDLAVQYNSAEVTKNEVILTSKRFFGLNKVERRLYIDKIESLMYGREIGALGIIMLLGAVIALIVGIVVYISSKQSAILVVGIFMSIILLMFFLSMCNVKLSIGIGGKVESITFKRGQKGKIKELYNQLLQVMEEKAKLNEAAVRAQIAMAKGEASFAAKVHTAAPENMQEKPSAKNE